MQLGFALTFEQLYHRDGLIAVDDAFMAALVEDEAELAARLIAARAVPDSLTAKEYSLLLTDLGPAVEEFLAQLFRIRNEASKLAEAHHALAPLFACKRLFVQRRAAKVYTPETGRTLAAREVREELSFAREVMGWLQDEPVHSEELREAEAYAAWALYTPEGKRAHRLGALFNLPHKLESSHLVPVARDEAGALSLPEERRRLRQGFALTDPRGSLEQALDHANYCIHCHHQEKDSCAKGMHEKDGKFRVSAQKVELTGCPLEEKISEMNELKSKGFPLAALAVVCVDNPLCAGTGHRICNDCMKACIYQKQEPVNIPLVETRALDDVLGLPYGFEIYSLLTRWNPMNIHQPLPREATGKKVLVAGMGPSGYTLAHYLLNDGHTVLGIDGLKIEPLPESLRELKPIRDVALLREPLESRISQGFGGVAEYGITVRWDKNYLTLIRLLLERRANFALSGGVRFGGQIDREGAFAMGFDHIALCLGAGRPTVLPIENGMARGVRTASDFLMALQLTGAARAESLANLQVRLPVLVVGGGLTAIDACTEALAYYPVQVEKFLARYEALGEGAEVGWSEEEREVAQEWLLHARTLRNAAPEEVPGLLHAWGGAAVVYRKTLTDAPSYRLNHEEVEKAMEEGIRFIENLSPAGVEVDGFGQARALCCEGGVKLPARTILIAAGTQPNTVLAREDAAHFALDGKYFQAVDEAGNKVKPMRSAKPEVAEMLIETREDGRGVSFFGDLHPSFSGNVVKAMASAKRGYPLISRQLEKVSCKLQVASEAFLRTMQAQLSAHVQAVNRLTPTIVEVVVHAPLAAARFEPGQFYKLQNFERSGAAPMEPLALTGAWVDAKAGLIGLIVLEMGGSSDLCARLSPGEAVYLMGPTGTPTEIPANETVLLAGGGLGNAVLFSIGRAMREKGCRVLYFAGYKTIQDRYKVAEIEAAADAVVWCCDEAPGFALSRPQDLAFVGNIVEAMAAYGRARGAGGRGQQDTSPDPRALIPLADIQRIVAIGSDRMMAAVAQARHGVLKDLLNPAHVAVGSINSPMQCMMKEICAQCLQRQVDPVTGEESYVFSCFNQDQPLDAVDFSHLAARLKSNTLQEKLTAHWIHEKIINQTCAYKGP